MPTNVIGMFRNREDANRAVEDLMASGFTRDQISLIASDRTGELRRYVPTEKGGHVEESALKGAGAGAVLGGLVGLIAGIGAVVLPGIGVVAGPIAGLVGGAALGAAGGGVVGALIALGVPENEAKDFEQRIRDGETLVAVHCPSGLEDRAERILKDHNAQDVDDRDLQTTSNQGTLASAQSTSQPTDQPSMNVVREDLEVGKKEVQTGGVRVRSYMTERPVQEQIELRQEKVNVERRPVDRPATDRDLETFKEGTIEMRETAEEPVVSKQARVVEEVVVSKDVDVRTQTVSDRLRETHVDVEPIEEFRQDWETRQGSVGGRFEDYSAAYSYGYRARNDTRYSGKDWSLVESDMRTDWEREHPGTWDKFKESIRSAWDKAHTRRANLY
jgi:uncharacterized protein (TIGR02271 family)